jgi:hypothetical protein
MNGEHLLLSATQRKMLHLADGAFGSFGTLMGLAAAPLQQWQWYGPLTGNRSPAAGQLPY